MTKSLYEDALADAKRLRVLAEETAKNRLVETIMPQIRDMVNRKILGEDLSFDDLEELESAPEDFSLEDPILEPIDTIDPVPLQHIPPEETLNGDVRGSVINIDADGDVNIGLESDDDDEILTDTMAEALARLLSGDDNKEFNESLFRLENTFKKLKIVLESIQGIKLNANQYKRINKSYAACVKEAHKLQKRLILIEQATQGDLEHRLTEIIKEMRNMSKSNNRNIFDFLFEAGEVEERDESLEEAELSLELSDDEREGLAGAEDAEAVDVALEDILGDLEIGLEQPEAAEAGEEDLGGEEGPEDEAGLEDEDLDLAAADEDLEEVYEVDEASLRRELNRLTEEASDEADQFGGGEVPFGDAFVDVDEEDLINALADELGSVSAVSSAPAVASESRRRRARRGNNSTNRRLREARRHLETNRATINELKKQLVEMNLFNAKLLYANKLMQNKNLSLKQQKSIVEALDNAKTIREAKLLFKSLSTSLVKKRSGKKLTEGALRRAGSSSRATRSAQPAGEKNPEAARWAVLAGI